MTHKIILNTISSALIATAAHAAPTLQSGNESALTLKDLGLDKSIITAADPALVLIAKETKTKDGKIVSNKIYAKTYALNADKMAMPVDGKLLRGDALLKSGYLKNQFEIISGAPLWSNGDYIVSSPFGITRIPTGAQHGSTLSDNKITFSHKSDSEEYTIQVWEESIEDAKKTLPPHMLKPHVQWSIENLPVS